METLKLPVSDFKWVPKNEYKRWTAKDIINVPSQDDTGYAFEVDLHYPSHLHQVNPIFDAICYLLILTSYTISFQAHDQFPLAPYTDTFFFKHLSPYNRRLLKHHCPRDYRSKRYHSKKFLSTFYDRKKYVVHLENLQFYLKKGMKLLKTRRVMKFRQKAFLKEFIEKVQSCDRTLATTLNSGSLNFLPTLLLESLSVSFKIR